MFYKKYKPAEALRDFVECYFIWEGDSRETIRVESPPTALCSLVFNYRDEYRISNNKYEDQPVPHCFISGQALSNYTFHLKGKIGVVGVAFRPAAVYHAFGIPMYELTDERICFSEIHPETCEHLRKQILEAVEVKDKIEVLEKYLIDVLNSANHGTPEIIESSNTIFDQKGKTTAAELLQDIRLSRRNFERKFLQEVGVSPKSYAKIRRFGYTCSLMAGKRDVNLMDVLFEGGYYDQSHFIKDFKYFSGRTPRKYVKTNIELANYIDGFSIVEQRLHSFQS